MASQKINSRCRCPLCPKAFGTARDMGIHVRRHEGCKPYTCKDCDKAFCTPFELDQHARTHTGERPYKCPTCACAFATLSTMHRHANAHRKANSVMYRCSVCPSIFRYATSCTAHERTHREDCRHRCKTCGRVFPQAFNLKRHMRLHDSNKTHSCDTCERSFYNKEHLDAHVQSCGKFRKCEVCGKGFREEAQLEAHIASQHDLATELSEEDGESAACVGDSTFEQEQADDQSSSEDGSGSNDTLSDDQIRAKSGWSIRLRARGRTNAPRPPQDPVNATAEMARCPHKTRNVAARGILLRYHKSMSPGNVGQMRQARTLAKLQTAPKKQADLSISARTATVYLRSGVP
ncbi:hypothetical protein HPB52_013005 [Rhipicephalus sanguineus]|uniref:C2H2-type domain-containing protein n=1 Tax=Rhipicephalus sanguineus TaxID=34632 RepID=A0A9D4QD40_RHISA|nr:hypothetical protein HPB52_013005 [Rhipicephalus sanguineus]